MIDRRGFIGAGLGAGAALALPPRPAVAATGVLPVPASGRLGFDVLYKGSKLGTHVLTFDRQGEMLTVDVAVDLALKLMGFTVYRYAHRGSERWAGGEIVAIQTSSNDNGTKHSVSARRGPAGLAVQGSGTAQYVAPADALPATHWNRRDLEGPWIDVQDGRLLRPRVTAAGVVAIPTAADTTIRAHKYALTGDARLDLFYDDRLGWAGLTIRKAGSDVRYVRQDI